MPRSNPTDVNAFISRHYTAHSDDSTTSLSSDDAKSALCRQHICAICGERLAAKKTLFRHMRGHGGAEACTCPHCDLTFSRKDVLKRHVEQQHNSRKVQCQYCGKELSLRYLKEQQHRCPQQVALTIRSDMAFGVAAGVDPLKAVKDILHTNPFGLHVTVEDLPDGIKNVRLAMLPQRNWDLTIFEKRGLAIRAYGQNMYNPVPSMCARLIAAHHLLCYIDNCCLNEKDVLELHVKGLFALQKRVPEKSPPHIRDLMIRCFLEVWDPYFSTSKDGDAIRATFAASSEARLRSVLPDVAMEWSPREIADAANRVVGLPKIFTGRLIEV